jgi:hypothetical protein
VLDAMTDKTFMVWSQRIIMALGAIYLGWGIWLHASA